MHSVVVIKENKEGIMETDAENIIKDLKGEIEKASNSITESHKRHQSAYYVGKKHGLEVALEYLKGLK